MKDSKKTHYRKVFKSDHLGIADLEERTEEGKTLILTIKEVKQHIKDPNDMNSGVSVAGKMISANIAHFTDSTIKPLVLNATNSKQVSKFAGSKYTEDWKDVIIELYLKSDVKMKGEIVGGVRIRTTQPQKQKPVLDPKSKSWEKAKKAVKDSGATFDSISKNYSITQANFDLLCS